MRRALALVAALAAAAAISGCGYYSGVSPQAGYYSGVSQGSI